MIKLSLSDLKEMIKEAEVKSTQETCTHLYQGKEYLIHICGKTYQCRICGKTIYK